MGRRCSLIAAVLFRSPMLGLSRTEGRACENDLQVAGPSVLVRILRETLEDMEEKDGDGQR